MHRCKTAYHEFHRVILPHNCYLRSRIAITPTIFAGKHVRFLEISLKTIICGNYYVDMVEIQLIFALKSET